MTSIEIEDKIKRRNKKIKTAKSLISDFNQQ